DGHRKWFGERQPDLRYSLIVNPRAAVSAEEFAAQIAYARSHGCGIVVYSWFEALRNAGTMEKLEKGMSIAGLSAREDKDLKHDSRNKLPQWRE
ncbi:MAG: hypothetical protein J6W10_09130, partial [Kiritimatiellae bacterium]|nr:hypothetical protein [Kiritimatiellia bacterium]